LLSLFAAGLLVVSFLPVSQPDAEAMILIDPYPGGPVLADGRVSIVLIGDSYTAGNGLGTYYGPKDYYRSHQNWGENYARWLREQGIKTTVTNLARGGDTTEGVLDENKKKHWSVAQLASNPGAIANADLIMLTIGGNDVEFAEIVKKCFVTVVANGKDCQRLVNAALEGLDTVMDDTTTIFERLAEMVDTSRTEVVLVGYPRLSLDTPAKKLKGCEEPNRGGVASLDPCEKNRYDQVEAVRHAGEQADMKQKALVSEWNEHSGSGLRVSYVDGISGAFEGHEPHPSTGDRNNYRWLNEFLETAGVQKGSKATTSKKSWDTSEWYHPNITGHEKMAEVVQKQIDVPKSANGGLWGKDPIDVAFVVDMSVPASTSTDTSVSTRFGNEVNKIASGIESRSKSARFGLVEFWGVDTTGHDAGYGSRVDRSRVGSEFTDSAHDFGLAVSMMKLRYGATTFPAQSMHSGIMEALDLDWRPGVRKVVMVISAMEPSNRELVTGYSYRDVRDKSLRVDPVEVYGIDGGELDSEAFRQISDATNGAVFDAERLGVAGAVDAAVARALDNPWAWIQGPYVAAVGDTVRLDAGGSYSPYGEIVSYEWDFDGDGVWDETTTDWRVDHQFEGLFDGVVGVRVTDPKGLTAVGSTPVLVSDDGDSTPRGEDNCPDVYNWAQVDSDGDGVGDECDDTPGLDGYVDADGNPLTKDQIVAAFEVSGVEPPEGGIADVPAGGNGGSGSGSGQGAGATVGVRGAGPVGGEAGTGGLLPVTGVVSPVWFRGVCLGLIVVGGVLVLVGRVRLSGGSGRGRHVR
jgi:lysophospholipase L1-like esterase